MTSCVQPYFEICKNVATFLAGIAKSFFRRGENFFAFAPEFECFASRAKNFSPLQCKIALIVLFLSSCSTMTSPSGLSSSNEPPVFLTSEARQAWLTSLKTWQATGSFAVIQGNEGWSGSFEWKQDGKGRYSIHFYGPFGAKSTYLVGTPNKVIWRDNEGKTTATTPEALVLEKTGLLFPVSYLSSWILGWTTMDNQADPYEYRIFDTNERLVSFEQAGWTVHYTVYQRVGSGELPQRILLENNQEKIHIKLFIREWKLAHSTEGKLKSLSVNSRQSLVGSAAGRELEQSLTGEKVNS